MTPAIPRATLPCRYGCQAPEVSDLIEGMARAIRAASGQDPDAAFFVAHADPRLRDDYPTWENWTAEARAAWAYALAALMAPGEGPLRAAFGGDAGALECWQAGVGAFAFLNGLRVPPCRPTERREDPTR